MAEAVIVFTTFFKAAACDFLLFTPLSFTAAASAADAGLALLHTGDAVGDCEDELSSAAEPEVAAEEDAGETLTTSVLSADIAIELPKDIADIAKSEGVNDGVGVDVLVTRLPGE